MWIIWTTKNGEGKEVLDTLKSDNFIKIWGEDNKSLTLA